MKIKYDEIELFKKDVKKLDKKFKTLRSDICVAKKNAIELFHLHRIDNQSIVPIAGFGNEIFKIYKLRKFACKALKGRGSRSGISRP